MSKIDLTQAYAALKAQGLTLEYVEEIAKMYGVKAKTVDINERFKEITQEMNDLHARKNADYGDSFGKSLDEDGLVASKVRIGDKFNRFGQLIKNPAQVKEESLRDTLIDMAVYSIKTIIWMEQDREPKRNKDEMDALTYAMKISKELEAFKGVEVPEPKMFYVPNDGNKYFMAGMDLDGDIVTLRGRVKDVEIEDGRVSSCVVEYPEYFEDKETDE